MNKKAINFDLDTKKLREFHPKGITQAYTDIRNFLESMGFEHSRVQAMYRKNQCVMLL